MKIRLSAFDRMYSGVMDVPEETGISFSLALTQPIQMGDFEKEIMQQPRINTICRFEWSGYYDMNGYITKEGNREAVKVYRLVDIQKR